MSSKIKSLAELAACLDELRGGEQRSSTAVVHCHGVFDLLHVGHIKYLQKARQLGDLLVVTVTPDRFVNKGPHRPAFQERLRLEALAALECVDYLAVTESETACDAIRLLRPDVYTKGGEFREQKTPELLEEEAVARDVGCRVEFIDAVTSSSSRLLNQYMSPFEAETEQYLQQFRQRYAAGDVTTWLAAARRLKVLVVGEAIIDEYYSCAAEGRSAKAPILATRYESHERFAGGALAVANHLASLAGRVDLISMLGTEQTEEAWVRSQLDPAVTPTFHRKEASPTIVKRRYRESYFGTPLFAIHFLSNEPLRDDEDRRLAQLLAERVADYDLVIVPHYGHQILTPRGVQAMADNARYLAVNTQANASNVGLHTISKYPRADYVSLAERELQLECRQPGSSVLAMLRGVAERLDAETLTVTRGKHGCVCYDRQHGDLQAPSLAVRVVDRLGAGDAFFAVTSLAAVVHAPLDVLAFLGNVAGAEAVADVGNARYLELSRLERHIESLFK